MKSLSDDHKENFPHQHTMEIVSFVSVKRLLMQQINENFLLDTTYYLLNFKLQVKCEGKLWKDLLFLYCCITLLEIRAQLPILSTLLLKLFVS